MDWNGLMADLDARVEDLEELVSSHGKRDEEQFQALAKGMDGLRADFSALRDTITKALSGDGELPGIRERVRALEKTEQDRKWALRIIWTALIGQAILLLFRVFAVKAMP